MSSTAIIPASQTVAQTAAGVKNQVKSISPFSTSSITLPALDFTPGKDVATPQKVNTPTPRHDAGWVHPRLNEVIRRRNATNFDGSNVKAILISLGLILFSFFVTNIYRSV